MFVKTGLAEKISDVTVDIDKKNTKEANKENDLPKDSEDKPNEASNGKSK